MEHQHDEQNREHAKASAAEPEKGRSLGNFLITHYTFALESDPIHAHSPKVHAPGLPAHARYRESFLGTKTGVGMQGTGLAEDGKYIHWAGGGTYGYGIGGAAGKPKAWDTCAVDKRVIPYGSHVEIDVYKNKGPFEANDAGGSIDGMHIDVFAGAIPIHEAYALGSKHSQVRLVKGTGHEDKPKHNDAPKTDTKPKHDTQGPDSQTAHHHKHHEHHDKHVAEAPGLDQARNGSAFIRRGSVGAGVKQIQEWVHVAADGIFGPITEGAVKEFQRRHGLEVDGVVGPHTMHAFDQIGRSHNDDHEDEHDHHGTAPHAKNDKPPHHKHHKHHNPASGSDPVAIARRFLKNPPLVANAPYLLKNLPHYTAAGGATNDCADFVSSVLMTAGKISFHETRVVDMKDALLSHGWHTVKKEQAQPGDVWLCLSGGIQHVTLVSKSGGAAVIGANGSGVEHINEEAIHYPGEIWLKKG
jgi:3D (Asp-Asp-Asp) domain-containing protein